MRIAIIRGKEGAIKQQQIDKKIYKEREKDRGNKERRDKRDTKANELISKETI